MSAAERWPVSAFHPQDANGTSAADLALFNAVAYPGMSSATWIDLHESLVRMDYDNGRSIGKVFAFEALPKGKREGLEEVWREAGHSAPMVRRPQNNTLRNFRCVEAVDVLLRDGHAKTPYGAFRMVAERFNLTETKVRDCYRVAQKRAERERPTYVDLYADGQRWERPSTNPISEALLSARRPVEPLMPSREWLIGYWDSLRQDFAGTT